VLARGLAAYGNPAMEVTLATMTPAGGIEDSALNNCLKVRVVRRPSVRLFRLIRQADVIHIAGPCIAPLALSVLLRKPVGVEHHGFQVVPTGTTC
jgi:hypothetical protein